MTAPTPDALASALPADDLGCWSFRDIAEFQAERLAEAGYVLVHTAPDEATVERLARALAKSEAVSFDLNLQAFRDHYTRLAEAALAALADTSAQARHADDDTTEGAS